MPTLGTPPITPMVAGTPPSRRTRTSTSRASSRLSGYGKPWAMSVDSKATTGVPRLRASATSSRIDIASLKTCAASFSYGGRKVLEDVTLAVLNESQVLAATAASGDKERHGQPQHREHPYPTPFHLLP